MDSSLKDEIDDGGSLLNQANVGPFLRDGESSTSHGVPVSV